MQLNNAHHNKRFILQALIILLIAVGYRQFEFSHGYGEQCLIPEAEHWIYEAPVEFTSYTVLYRPQVLSNVEVGASPFQNEQQMFLTRYLTMLLSLLTIPLLLRLGYLLDTNWGWISALFVAVAPWFVWSDRLLIAHDLVPLVIALHALSLIYLRKRETTLFWIALHHVSAMSLLVIAPTLWWVAFGLLFIAPHRDWRIIVFVSLASLLTFPTLQHPVFYLTSLTHWNMATSASCILLALLLSLFIKRDLRWGKRLILLIVVIVIGVGTALEILNQPSPTKAQWDVIDTLQRIIQDDALVDLDGDFWGLQSVIRCSVTTDIKFTARPINQTNLAFNPLSRRYDTIPNIAVYTADNPPKHDFPYVYDVGGYLIGREVNIPNPTDIPIGNQLHLIGYDLDHYRDDLGQILDVRLDFQTTETLSADVLAYSLFIRMKPIDDTTATTISYNLAFAQELQLLTPRAYNLNRRYRIPLSDEIPNGDYEVTVGFYNIYAPSEVYHIQSLGAIALVTSE